MKFFQTILLIFCFGIFANAQNKIGFCGTVTDEFGAAIPAAKIEINSSKSGKFKTVSDSEGNFDMQVFNGLYKILIKADSYKIMILKNQSLPFELTKCIQIKLKSNVPPHQIT